MGKTSTPAVDKPDGLNSLAKAQNIAGQLVQMQQSLDALELEQIANDAKDTDPVPGIPPQMENGEVVLENGRPVFITYGERIAGFEAAIERLWQVAHKRKVARLVTAVVDKMNAEDKVREEELLAT